MDTAQDITAADDPRWQAVTRRDGASDGSFVYAVTSTGIYCRPSCPSRPKRREHVHFYADAAAARAAGFRACLRCQPDEDRMSRRAEQVAAACRILAEAEAEPTLAELAAAIGLSPAYLQRQFKAELGLSPKGYMQALRRERLHESLETAETVTAAIFEAGYGSTARGYAATAGLGLAPAKLRKGAKGERIAYATAATGLGTLLVAATARGLCLIAFCAEDAAEAVLRKRFPQALLAPDAGALAQRLAQVVAFVEAPGAMPDLPLDIRGTAFQEKVWQALTRIPLGEVLTYAGLAQAIGQPTAVRAVARACATNDLAVLIPCHRVIGSDGSLTGYAWGVDVKRGLLARERDAAAGRDDWTASDKPA